MIKVQCFQNFTRKAKDKQGKEMTFKYDIP